VADVSVIGANKVAVLSKPNVRSYPTGEYLLPGETFNVVARTLQAKDGRVYLRVRHYSGWVSTRSRKDLSKLVLAPAPGQPPIEPSSCSLLMKSKAMHLLPKLDADGKKEACTEPVPKVDGQQANGQAATMNGQAATMEPQRFRSLARSAILGEPSLTGQQMAGACLVAKEEFVADGVFLQPAEGRAYLHLQDGRGWVCERSKTDFNRFVVEPRAVCDWLDAGSDHEEEEQNVGVGGSDKGSAAAAASSMRSRVAGRQKVVMVQKSTDDVGSGVARLPNTDTNQDETRSNGPVIYRSDLELWPEELRPPQPLSKEVRVKLRRLFNTFGVKIQECNQDIEEVTKRASSYARACPGQKELQQYAEALQKEAAKVSKEWVKSVQEILKSSCVETKEDNLEPCDRSSGLAAVQVKGIRWYCAMLRGIQGKPSEEADECSNVPEVGTSRCLGPLRPSAELATKDLDRIQQALGQDGTSSAKRRRLLGRGEEGHAGSKVVAGAGG